MHAVGMSFLDGFVDDNPYTRRCLSECDFDQELGIQRKDIPLYNQYNNGLTACEEGYEREHLQFEGNELPVTNTPSALADQAVARYPGSQQAQARGLFMGKEMAPVIPGQAPGARPGLTGYIPSVEEGMAKGMMTGIAGSLALRDNLNPAEEQERQRRGQPRGFLIQ